jgi:steroid delta-isomerase-like uncharacterized protein
MSTEANRALVRRIFLEAMNEGRDDLYDELLDQEYVNHDFPAPRPGVEGFRTVVQMFKAAFADFRVTLADELAEGDRVATRGYFTGRHQGEFMGVPATGKTIKVAFIDIWRIENGKARENWVQMDMVGLMQQIGAGTAPVA